MYKQFFILLFSATLACSPLALSGQSETAVAPVKEKKKKPVKPSLTFSLKGGNYQEAIEVELHSPGAAIYYTTDGSKPSKYDRLYRKPITFKKTKILRAVAIKGKLKSKIIGHTYFIDEPSHVFPVVSLGVDPEVLFDPETGLYMKGPNAMDSLWTKDGANFWSRREVKMNTEIFETDGQCVFNSPSGLRLFGGISRLFPQKSMTVVARDRYGKKRIRHRLFGKEGLKKYKFLVLRNSGSDWGKSHFRDGLMTGLLKDWDLDMQDFRPSVVYINGKYWGIYNIREKVNRYFIEGHHDIDNDSIDLIEHRMTLKRGSRGHYLKMLRYLKKHSMSNPAHYSYIQSQMEVQNFMDYQIAQIFFDNQDAGGNIKFWRPQTSHGKWRWILYDTDFGFGLHYPNAYKHNSLAFHLEPNGPDWPNPPWSTLILRKLMDNSDFRRTFVNRFADYLNTSFTPERILGHVEQHYNTLKPEIDQHLDRWRLDKDRWENHVNIIRKFARRRPEFVRMHIMERFNTGDQVEVSLISSPGGQITLNDNVVVKDDKVFRGSYFKNYPIHLKAQARFGYRFSHWEGIPFDVSERDVSLSLADNKPLRIQAVFEAFEHPLSDQIVINEISSNNKKAGDWVELFNTSKEKIQLDRWIFTDGKNEFRLPNVAIDGKSYLILCQDSIAFRKQYPEWIKAVGNFDFGLNKVKETVCLYTDKGASIDSTSYVLAPTDSTFALSLLLPHLDNGDQENWEIQWGVGTPSGPNPYYLESHIKAEQEMWVRVGVSIGVLMCCFLVLHFKKRKKKVAPIIKKVTPKPPPHQLPGQQPPLPKP